MDNMQNIVEHSLQSRNPGIGGYMTRAKNIHNSHENLVATSPRADKVVTTHLSFFLSNRFQHKITTAGLLYP